MADYDEKFRAGVLAFDRGEIEVAIHCVQDAKADATSRVECSKYLGECYIRLGWYEVAVTTLKEAIEMHSSASDETAIDLRRQLAVALRALNDPKRRG